MNAKLVSYVQLFCGGGIKINWLIYIIKNISEYQLLIYNVKYKDRKKANS